MANINPPPTIVESFNDQWRRWMYRFWDSLIPEDWIAPTLENSWVNYDGAHNPAGYYKDAFGRVHIRGSVKDGTTGLQIFTLPEGYRPAYKEIQTHLTWFSTSFSSLACTISTDGTVISGSGLNTQVVLDGISFRAA